MKPKIVNFKQADEPKFQR